MTASDPFNLYRFVEAQQGTYGQAVGEIRAGRKRTHWMWFIFPQFEGLGTSAMASHFAIRSVAEAEAYLRHPVLGPRLLECAEAALGIPGRSGSDLFGYPDDVKLRSCATLFAVVSPTGSIFERLLEKYFAGERDERTIQLLDSERATRSGRHERRSNVKLDIYVNYRGTCEAAFRFYEQYIGGRITGLLRHQEQPNPNIPPEWDDKVLHARMEIGATVLMGADIPQSEPMRSAYLALSLDREEDAERVYALLADGGEIFMKMEKTGFANRFAMLRDRFGTSWMLLHQPTMQEAVRD